FGSRTCWTDPGNRCTARCSNEILPINGRMRSLSVLLLCSSALVAQQPPQLPPIELVQQALGVPGQFEEIEFEKRPQLEALSVRPYRQGNIVLEIAVLPPASQKDRADQLTAESLWERQRQSSEIAMRDAPAKQRELWRKESAERDPVIRFADGRRG